MIETKHKERIGKGAFLTAAILCIIAVASIFIFLIAKSLPAFKKIGFFNFLLGKDWTPDRNDVYAGEFSGSYGIFPMLLGTIAATAGALLFGGTLGYFTAVFIAFFCPKRLKGLFSAVMNLLAGIPSVVYGFFGLNFLLPKLAYFAPNDGTGLLATSIILGIMILPTVVSLSKTSLEAVPRSYYQGAIGLGSSHTQAVFKAVVPAAKSGITASLILGVGRALGETMAVVMVAGNGTLAPSGLFGSFRTLTASIVLEMGYAGEVQKGALVATGVVLLAFVFLVNTLFGAIAGRAVKGAVKPKKRGRTSPLAPVFRRVRDGVGNVAYTLKSSYIGRGAAMIAGGLSGFALLLVIGFIFAKGLPHLNLHLLFGKFEFAGSEITIFPSIISTLMAIFLSLLIALPVGIMTAIYLSEYAKHSNVFIRIVRGAIDVLSGVPSIVYGLFGMITFVRIFGGNSSILAGSFTVSIMLLPTVVRSTEESLKCVPDSLREGSFALGAGKMRTIFKVVLPSALSGILSATILSMGRVLSESAPFLYTMGSVITATPTGYTDSGATLAVALYQLSGEGWHVGEAYATAVVLIVLVLGLNLLTEWIGRRLQKKQRGEKE